MLTGEELVVRPSGFSAVRPQVGLLLSIGEPPATGRNHPRKLPYFRPKPGQLNQYHEAVDQFARVYGPGPTKLDIVLLSDIIGDSLDIRVKWWGQSGLKGMGKTNYATVPPDEFRDRIEAWDDEILAFLDDQPQPVLDQLKGPGDERIAKYQMKVYATFRFALHKVTGLTTLAEITTTSKRSMSNLHTGLYQVAAVTGGRVAGIPYELAMRPARTRYWEEKERKRKTSEFFELVFQTPYTLSEFFAHVRERQDIAAGTRAALPPVRHDDAEAVEELAPAMWRSAAEQEVVEAIGQVGPPEEVPGPDDTVGEADAPTTRDTSGGGDPEVGKEAASASPTVTEGQGSFPIPARARRHEDRG